MSFYKWFLLNFYDNLFTIISIIVSGIISMTISYIFYHKSNRSAFEKEVIYPMIAILNQPAKVEFYKELQRLVQNYTFRYVTKKESDVINNLLNSYKDISEYTLTGERAECLEDYFYNKMDEIKAEVKMIPLRIYDPDPEIVGWDYLPDFDRLIKDLETIVRQYTDNYCDEDLYELYEKDVINCYNDYFERFYDSKEIACFKDFSLQDVFQNSKVEAKWRNKFERFYKFKNIFTQLKIVTHAQNKLDT